MNNPAEFSILKAAADGDLRLLQQLAAADPEVFLEKCERAKDCQGLTALHRAAVVGKTPICKFLIEDVKVNVNSKADEGDTPLLLAIKADNLRTAIYMTQHGVDVNESDYEGKTPLYFHVNLIWYLVGCPTLIQLLISKGAEIESVCDYGTPLVAAASKGKKEAVKILLDHNANPNVVSHQFFTPLLLSILAESPESDPNIGAVTPLALAVDDRLIRIVGYLLDYGADPNAVDSSGLTPLEHAALNKDHESVRILFPQTRRIQSYPVWSIRGIMRHIHSEEARTQRETMGKEMFQLSKTKGKEAFAEKEYFNAICWYSKAIFVDPDDEKLFSNRSLCWARLNKGHPALSDAEDCVRLKPNWSKGHYRRGAALKILKNFSMAATAFSVALKLNPDNEEIEKELMDALKLVSTSLVSKLAAADAEGFLEKCERAKDCHGLTALHRAAVVGKTQICKFLIEDVKVNINAKTDKGDTPLLLAIKTDHLNTAIYLTQHGVDVNESDFKGKTPLHCASEKGHATLIQLLISNGADIEAVYDYETPLLAAASKGKKEAVKILLDHNANPNSASCLSLNPVMLSILDHSIECLDMLLKALFINPCDAKVLSNRSLCWAHLSDGDRALKDAEDCVKFKPDWPKAHYREGVAWMLLKNYSMASEAFSLAKRLDPESKEIHKAFKEAVEAEFDMEVSDNIQALHIT
ncbi:hypothetical protein ACJIZ3_011815 [Penstemon smallii]|uniref:Uncharacterized protein n=1 Tax=Penstemon smallii TaxID=265156 RepID=A0ABD3UPK4_9LAMI